MKHRIRTQEELSWFLAHTHRFHSGQVRDLHVHKRRLWDESTGREVVAGTILTAMIDYQVPFPGAEALYGTNRTAKLTMIGVTDFSIFEQDGVDNSEIGLIHAEVADGRLRFWFDPQGQLYVVCEEAELEEVSIPGGARPLPLGVTSLTFQADGGELPDVCWFLHQLDGAGIPCVWRESNPTSPHHPAWRWKGYLTPTTQRTDGDRGFVYVQAYGPMMDGARFGVLLRPCDPDHPDCTRLVLSFAHILFRHFQVTCLAGRKFVDREESRVNPEWGWIPWWDSVSGWG